MSEQRSQTASKETDFERFKMATGDAEFMLVLAKVHMSLPFELGRIIGCVLKVPVGRFIDVFFDNLISDWVIQRKIKNALNNVESTFDKIRRYVLMIEKEMSNLDANIIALQDNVDGLLEQ